MRFDGEGRVVWSPREFFDLMSVDPRRTIDNLLFRPRRVPSRAIPGYCDFLAAVRSVSTSTRRAWSSGELSGWFSISPDNEKLWAEFDEYSDSRPRHRRSALLRVDRAAGRRVGAGDRLGARWPQPRRPGPGRERFADRQQDRFYNCCRVDDLPHHLCPHHIEAMEAVADLECSGSGVLSRRSSTAADGRCDRAMKSDIRKLCSLVEQGQLDEPGVRPSRSFENRASPAAAATSSTRGRGPHSAG